MKRIILLFIITLTSLTISAKEVVKNLQLGSHGQHNEHLLHQRELWSPHSWNRRESKCFYCFYKYQPLVSNFSVEMKSVELE